MRDSFIRIIVAHPLPLYADALAAMLRVDPKFLVVAQCSDEVSLRRAFADQKAEVLLADQQMLALRSPEMPIPPEVRVVALCDEPDGAAVLAAVNGNVSGILFGDATSSDLIACIHHVVQGGLTFPPSVVLRALERGTFRVHDAQRLTDREQEIANFVAAGHSNKRIAHLMGISEGTVKAHVHSIFRKLKVGNRVQLSLEMREKATG